MAHKGKVYPYLWNRDLSLAPGARWGLPLAFRWTGILATGSFASLFVGKTFDLEVVALEPYYSGYIAWGKSVPRVGGSIEVTIAYYLTFDEQFSQMAWQIQDSNYGTLARTDFYNTTLGWPYNQIKPSIINPWPAQLLISYAGNFFPKPW
jgi:hypothetical protein